MIQETATAYESDDISPGGGASTSNHLYDDDPKLSSITSGFPSRVRFTMVLAVSKEEEATVGGPEVDHDLKPNEYHFKIGVTLNNVESFYQHSSSSDLLLRVRYVEFKVETWKISRVDYSLDIDKLSEWFKNQYLYSFDIAEV
jgi:hypothetical protein